MKFLHSALAVGLLLSSALAQGPLTLNTVSRSFTPVTATPYLADVRGYTDSLGRDFALICRGNTGFAIYEITNPMAPVLAATIPATGSDLKDVDVVGQYAYLIQQSGPVMIVSLADPYAAAVVATFGASGHTGNYEPAANLYTQCRNGASPFDARFYSTVNPVAPVQIGNYNIGSTQSHDAFTENGIAYVSALFNPNVGTHILDISNPLSPVLLNNLPSGTTSHSSYLYNAPGNRKYLLTCNETAGGRIRIFDVTNPVSAPLVGQYQSATGAAISIHNPQVVDRYCFISYYEDYLRIIDLSVPSAPVEVGIFDPDPTNVGAAVFDGCWAVHCFKQNPDGSYRVVVAESFNAPLGFYVIDFFPPPRVNLVLETTGVGDLNLGITGADPFSESFTAISLTTTQLIGTGPLAGLASDALFSLLQPLGAVPFHLNLNGSGSYSFSLPPAAVPPGLNVDVRGLAPKLGLYRLTELGRINF